MTENQYKFITLEETYRTLYLVKEDVYLVDVACNNSEYVPINSERVDCVIKFQDM